MSSPRQEKGCPRRPRPHPRSRQAFARMTFLRAAAATALFAAAITTNTGSTRWFRLVDAASTTGCTATTTSGASGVPVRTPLVFRVEGSRDDPEFERACGVVKGLADLYGEERYVLHAVVPEDPGDTLQQQQHSPARRRRSWLPGWLCGSSSRESPRSTLSSPSLSPEPTSPPNREGKSHRRAVLCSISIPPAAAVAAAAAAIDETQQQQNGPTIGKYPTVGDDGIDGVDTSVTIGGVEELLEFVRSSILAGPRPFSFAFHEQSLR